MEHAAVVRRWGRKDLESPPTRSEVAEALRIAWRGYLSDPDGEGGTASWSVGLTDDARKHVLRMLDRLALDPADPRCRVCGKSVDAPGDSCCAILANAEGTE